MKVNKDIALVTIAIVGFVILIGSTSKKTTKRKKRYKIPYHIFDSPDVPNSGRCIDKKLVQMLIELQKQINYPIFQHINSAVRTHSWNKKVGGVSN